MQTLNEVIGRLEGLRRHHGGEIPVEIEGEDRRLEADFIRTAGERGAGLIFVTIRPAAERRAV